MQAYAMKTCTIFSDTSRQGHCRRNVAKHNIIKLNCLDCKENDHGHFEMECLIPTAFCLISYTLLTSSLVCSYMLQASTPRPRKASTKGCPNEFILG